MDGTLLMSSSRLIWDENEFVQQIWIANAATGDRYQLTSGRKSSQNPLWSQDSKRLAFVSDRDGKKQIYVINPHGGEAQQLTSEDNGVMSFHWAPDGSAIAFTSTGPDAKSKKDRKDKYGDFEIIEGDYSQVHLWLVKAPADIPSDPKLRPKPELLTESDKFSVGDFSWSPDSRHIAFSAARDPDLSSGETTQLYTLDLADRHVKKLLDSNGPNDNPRWSPDGQRIAYVTGNGDPFFFYADERIAVIPAAGGEPRILTAKFDEDSRLIDWGQDGIYFSALQKTAGTPVSLESGEHGHRSHHRAGYIFHGQCLVHAGPSDVCRGGGDAQSFLGSLRVVDKGFCAEVSERRRRPVEKLQACHARSGGVEIQRWHAYPGHSC